MNRVFNHHLYYVIVSALLVIVLFLPFVDDVADLVTTNAGRRPNETFDVRITDKEAIFTVVLKSKGPLRNPIYKYTGSEVMNLNSSSLRRAVMARMCNDINHKYMNGINCIYLNYYRH